jgi:hypothetical protein
MLRKTMVALQSPSLSAVQRYPPVHLHGVASEVVIRPSAATPITTDTSAGYRIAHFSSATDAVTTHGGTGALTMAP